MESSPRAGDRTKATMTKWQLFSLLGGKGADAATLTLRDGRTGIVQSVTRESGSGDSFIVRVLVSGQHFPVSYGEDVYVKTID